MNNILNCEASCKACGTGGASRQNQRVFITALETAARGQERIPLSIGDARRPESAELWAGCLLRREASQGQQVPAVGLATTPEAPENMGDGVRGTQKAGSRHPSGEVSWESGR